MRPSQVLDMQHDLAVRCEDAAFRRAVSVTIMAELVQTESLSGLAPEHRDQVLDEWADVWIGQMAAANQAAYCYQVTPEMCEVVDQAADTLDESDEWHWQLAPTTSGFVRFDKPINLGQFLMADGSMSPSVAADFMVWGPGISPDGDPRRRTFLYWFADGDRPGEAMSTWLTEHGYGRQSRRILGRWQLVGWDSFPDGRSLGPPVVRDGSGNPVPTEGAQGVGTFAIMSIAKPEGEEADHPVQRNTARVAHALWLLLGQTIVTMRHEPLERASLRRAMKKRLPGVVTTVLLRRSETPYRTDRETEVEWQHRWVVRWHWRWQPYGKHNADHVHQMSEQFVVDGLLTRVCEVSGCDHYVRRKIIDAYIKGPPDKPLIGTEKVYLLGR